MSTPVPMTVRAGLFDARMAVARWRCSQGPVMSGARLREWLVGCGHRAMPVLFAVFALTAHAGDLQRSDIAPRLDTELANGAILPARHLDGRVVLHYFWATWCPICRTHMPALEQLYQAYRSRGLEILAHSLDDEPSDVIRFWRERRYTFPVAMRSEETRAGFGGIRGTPTLVLVDRAGRVRLRHLGAMSAGELEAWIKALLNERATPMRD